MDAARVAEGSLQVLVTVSFSMFEPPFFMKQKTQAPQGDAMGMHRTEAHAATREGKDEDQEASDHVDHI